MSLVVMENQLPQVIKQTGIALVTQFIRPRSESDYEVGDNLVKIGASMKYSKNHDSYEVVFIVSLLPTGATFVCVCIRKLWSYLDEQNLNSTSQFFDDNDIVQRIYRQLLRRLCHLIRIDYISQALRVFISVPTE